MNYIQYVHIYLSKSLSFLYVDQKQVSWEVNVYTYTPEKYMDHFTNIRALKENSSLSKIRC